jgi:hypothetical protein
MKTTKALFAILTCTTAVAFQVEAQTSPTNLLINGSFESPVVPDERGESSLPGWTVEGPVFGLTHGPEQGLSAVDGQQWAYFGGTPVASGTSVSQTFGTVVGQAYTVLTMWVRMEPATSICLAPYLTLWEIFLPVIAACPSAGIGFRVRWALPLQPATRR